MCLFPSVAKLPDEGFGRPAFTPDGDLRLPCGKCSECISSRAFDWATRAKHEISLHEESTFITLTYDDEHLPSHLVVKDPFQRFMKRLRDSTKKKLSYIVSHEYGSHTFRPHHHAIIFGYDFKNQFKIGTSKGGSPLFTSPELQDIWREPSSTTSNGFVSIGQANEKTAYYIASYALKGKTHQIDLPDGTSARVSDSFDCSKRPGIGLNYFLDNYKQLVNSGEILPRYYLKKLKDLDPGYYELYENRRMESFKNRTLQQRLAKYTISKTKTTLDDNEFRTAPRSSEFDRVQQRMKYDVAQDTFRNKGENHAKSLFST